MHAGGNLQLGLPAPHVLHCALQSSLRAMQEFMDVARQNLPMLSGLPAPLMQALNKNDPEELQRIFRCECLIGIL